MNGTKYFSTVGYMCQMFQRSPAWVTSKLRDLKAEPAMVLNGLAYYSGEDHNAVLALFPATDCPARRPETSARRAFQL